MMSSLIAKANKSRSPASQKVRTTKGKKAASKKLQRPGKITAAPETGKSAPAKTKKQVSANRKPANQTSKKSSANKKPVKASAEKPVKKSIAKQPARKQVTGKRLPPAKSASPPKKAPSPGALAAVRAFEQALKLFNRHDYAAAKPAFEGLLKKFGDQSEIAARARTYQTICAQRLARTSSVPRNPDALYDQGVFELNKGAIREAISLFEKALKAQPRADHVYYSLAAAYARLNDPSKALDALRRAIGIRSVHRSQARRDPDFASLHGNEDFQQLTGFGFDFDEE
jgi:tetratricopeptide (TPR) repeat protein